MNAETVYKAPAPTPWVELFEDGLRWHRLAQAAVHAGDREASRRAWDRRRQVARDIVAACPDLTERETLARFLLLARVDTDSRPICPCGIGFVVGSAIAYSPAWHREHRRIHLDTFPDVDATTITNLDDAITYAERNLP